MRILFCNFEYPPLGGEGGFINALLAEEMAIRHEVVVVTSQGSGSPPESVERGVRIVRVPVPFRRQQAAASMASMLGFVLRGKRVGDRLFREGPVDVINTHFVLPSGPVGAALAEAHIDGIKSRIQDVASAASSAVSKARDYFPFSPAKKGPFSGKGYTPYSGQALMEDFAGGIKSRIPDVRSALNRGLSVDLLSSIGSPSVQLAGVSAPERQDAFLRSDPTHGRRP